MRANSLAKALKGPMVKRTLASALVLALALSFLLSPVNVSAATHDVSGTLPGDTVWVTGETYVVTGQLIVPDGVTLTIQEGVIVLFEAGAGIYVQGGSLVVEGTAASPVLFDANAVTNATDYWTGITAVLGTTSAPTVSISNAVFHHALTAVSATGAEVDIRDSEFSENYYAISLTNCDEPIISGNVITDNDAIGIMATYTGFDTGEVTIEDNVVSDNGQNGIYLVGYSSDIGSVEVRRNTVEGNQNVGIYIQVSDADTNFENIVIEDNIVNDNGGYGVSIYAYNDLPSVAMSGNNVSGNSGYGVLVSTSVGGIGSILVEDNTVRDNGGYGVDILVVEEIGTATVRGNVFEDNAYDGIYLSAYGLGNVTIVDNVASGSENGNGIFVYSFEGIENVSVIGNTAENNRYVGLYVVGTEIGEVAIEGNTANDNSDSGIYVHASNGSMDGIVVEDNVASRNSVSGIHISVGPGGAEIGSVVIDANAAENNGGDGIFVSAADGDIGDVLVSGNFVHNNTNAGICFDANDYGDVTVIDNNVQHNGGHGVCFDGANYGDVTVTDNILCHNGGDPFRMNGAEFGDIVVERNNICDGSGIWIGGENYYVPEPGPEPPPHVPYSFYYSSGVVFFASWTTVAMNVGMPAIEPVVTSPVFSFPAFPWW